MLDSNEVRQLLGKRVKMVTKRAVLIGRLYRHHTDTEHQWGIVYGDRECAFPSVKEIVSITEEAPSHQTAQG